MKKLLALLAFFAALAAQPLWAADASGCAPAASPRSVTTTGTVNVTVPADSAKLSVSLSVLDPNLEQSNRHLDQVLAALQAELNARGIPEKAVVLQNRNVQKSWDDSYSVRKRTLLGYTASAQVVIAIDDIAKLSPLITYLGLHEEYSSWSPDLRSSKMGEERKAVLALALRTARNKAEVLAQEGGAKLGALQNATEEDAWAGGYGSNLANMAQNAVVVAPGGGNGGADNSNDGSADSPIPAGSHMIAINVRIRATFALE